MSGPAPDPIIKQIAKLGPRHLITEGIMRYYNRKPILLYITFWDDNDVDPDLKRVKPDARNRYAAASHPETRCVVENYRTAFSFILASRATKRLAERERQQRVPGSSGADSLPVSSYALYDGEHKPVDYHFLQSFHATNLRHVNLPSLHFAFTPFVAPAREPDPVWWPNVVVRLSELATAITAWPLPVVSEVERTVYFWALFGVLAPRHVRLQGYFILIDCAYDDARTLRG